MRQLYIVDLIALRLSHDSRSAIHRIQVRSFQYVQPM